MLTPMQARIQHGIDDANAGAWDYLKCRCANNGDYCDYCEAFYRQREEAKADRTDPVVKRYLAEKDDPMCECGGFESEHDENGCRRWECYCPKFVAAEPFEDRERERC